MSKIRTFRPTRSDTIFVFFVRFHNLIITLLHYYNIGQLSAHQGVVSFFTIYYYIITGLHKSVSLTTYLSRIPPEISRPQPEFLRRLDPCSVFIIFHQWERMDETGLKSPDFSPLPSLLGNIGNIGRKLRPSFR